MQEENTSNQQQEQHVISEYYEGVQELEKQGYETAIRNARNALFATAVLVLIGELVSASTSGIGFTPEILAIIAVEVGLFVALGFWTKKKPYSAIIIGLILFLLMWAAAIALNGFRGAIGGIIFKIIVIYYLAKALKDAKAWEQMNKNRG